MLLTTLSPSCHDLGSYEQPTEKAPPKKMMIILCDLTSSLSSAKSNLEKNFTSVLEAIPLNTDFEVYAINERVDPPLMQGNTGDDSEKRMKTLARCEGKAHNLFNTPSANHTCIINTMDIALGRVKEAEEDSTYQKIAVVLLSDMLEVCPLNGRPVNLEITPRNTLDIAYRQANESLAKWPGKQYRFDSRVFIAAVVNSAEYNEMGRLQQFWSQYFRKIGYTKEVELSPVFSKKSIE